MKWAILNTALILALIILSLDLFDVQLLSTGQAVNENNYFCESNSQQLSLNSCCRLIYSNGNCFFDGSRRVCSIGENQIELDSKTYTFCKEGIFL